MAITTAQLTEALEKTGLLTADRIKDCCETAALPLETTLPEVVAKQLVRSGHLTRFQAQLALSGKASSLVLGSYVVLEKIGQGGMGQVYKARHKTMKREVALKVISPAVVKDETSRRRFQREVEAAAQLNHPNIVTAHDAGEFKGTHYLVMEYIRGTDLSSLVKAQGAIGLASAVGYILQVARGLSFAHSQGIVHRDIKPANLLLDESGLVKILDMGLARFDDGENAVKADAGLTGTGMLMGTIDYMSPEQAMDSKNADARSDIYSLGCTLYFLTTGRAMFEADTIVKRLMAHQSAIIPKISHADQGLQQILEKMTAKQAEQRYASCEKLIAELQLWLNHNAVAASPQRSAVSQGVGSRMSMPNFRAVSDNVASDSSDATMDTFVSDSLNAKASDTTPSLSGVAETLMPVNNLPQHSLPTHTLPVTPSAVEKLVMPESETLVQSAPSIIVDSQSTVSSRGRSRVRLQDRRAHAAGGKGGRRSWKIYGGLAGGAALVLLAVLVFRLKTPTGTIIIEADQPDIVGAVISVDEKQTITLETGNGQEPIEIRADEKEHTLKVTKGGFESFTQKFRVKAGATQTITVRLEPTGPAKTDVMPPAKESAGSGWHGWPADAPPPAIAPFDAEQARQHQEAWAKYLNVDVEYTNSIGMKFRLIPPGEFMMGSTSSEIEEAFKFVGEDKHWQDCVKSEAPQHKVILTQAIYMGINEITQAEYEKVMGVNPSHFSPMGAGKEAVAGMETTRLPVEMVSWNDAAEFCAKLSKQEELKPFYLRVGKTITPLEGTGYRLPTEAEWEYACRAGTTTKFWVGDKDEDLTRAGWFTANSGGRTHAAGELKANPYGLYGIHGNVFEWVEDWWELTYYGEFQEKPAINPVAPSNAGAQRVVRGGYWAAVTSSCRAAFRNAHGPSDCCDYLGFRVSLPVTVRRKPAGSGMELSSASTPLAPVAGPVDYEAEREAAEWVLSVGGALNTIDESGVIAWTGPGVKLPDGQWQLNDVALYQNIMPGDLDKLVSCRNLKSLDARVSNIGDSDCVTIGRMTNLEVLTLVGTHQITNTGIKNLGALQKLRRLSLVHFPISDEAMDVIASMTELRKLDLVETPVTDVGFKKLETLVHLEEQLNLPSGVTDQGLSILGSFPQLKKLGLYGHQVTDSSIAEMQKLPRLTELYLIGATDETLSRMKGLIQLRGLELNLGLLTEQGYQTLQELKWLQAITILSDPKFNDAKLKHLSKIPDLKILCFFDKDCSVSPKGIEDFRAARPDVRVDGVQVYPATVPAKAEDK
jgi:serine/threonine protein kinase/formylglycine-generating enzyme required for sulfatase activity